MYMISVRLCLRVYRDALTATELIFVQNGYLDQYSVHEFAANIMYSSAIEKVIGWIVVFIIFWHDTP